MSATQFEPIVPPPRTSPDDVFVNLLGLFSFWYNRQLCLDWISSSSAECNTKEFSNYHQDLQNEFFHFSKQKSPSIMQRLKILFTHHWLFSNTLTSCGQIGTADALQQVINGDVSQKGWDWRRTLRMAAVGLVIGPMLHNFYRVLDSRKFRGEKRIVVMKKLFWDTAFIPVFSCTFINVAGLYEGKSLPSCLHEYRSKMWHIWKVDFAIWPPAQILNFYFLPHSIRVIYVNFVSLIYNCLMSYIKNNDVHIQ